MTDAPNGAPQVATAEIRIDDVLRRSYEILSRNFSIFAALAAVMWLPYLVEILRHFGQTAEDVRGNLPGLFLSVILAAIFPAFGETAIVYAALQIVRDRPVAIGESLQKALGRVLPVIGLTFLVGFAVVIGLILLVIPAFYVMTIFFFVLPVCVEENLDAIGSMERSLALTKGYRWKIFAITILVWVASGIVAVILGAAAKLGGALAHNLVISAWNAVSGTFYGIVAVVIYRDIRVFSDAIAAPPAPASG